MLSSASQGSCASENSSLGNNYGHHSFAQPLQPVLEPSLRLVTQHFPSLCHVSDELADFKAVGCPWIILDREPTRSTIILASSETETPLPVTKWKSSPNMLPSPSTLEETSFTIPEIVSSMNVKSRI